MAEPGATVGILGDHHVPTFQPSPEWPCPDMPSSQDTPRDMLVELGTRMSLLWMAARQQKADQKDSICLLRAISGDRGSCDFPEASDGAQVAPVPPAQPPPPHSGLKHLHPPLPGPEIVSPCHLNLPTSHSGGRTSVSSSLFLYLLV